MNTVEEEIIRVNNLPFVFNKHISDILDFFKFAIREKNTSAVIVIDGKSGKGKTTLSNQIGAYCDTNGYSIKKLHFTPETFLNGSEEKIGLANCQAGDVIVFDEAMLISSRSAMSHFNKMVVTAMSMIRSKRIMVIFNVNAVWDIDRNLVLSRADILFSVYGENLIDRGHVMAFFKSIDGRDRLKELYFKGKKYYDYSQPKSNFNCDFSKNFIINEEEYEINKQKGVNDYLSSMEKKRKVTKLEKKFRKALYDLFVWFRENHPQITIRDLEKMSGIDNSTISVWLDTGILGEDK